MIFEVRDRGIGIDPERIKEALDVFGQLDRDEYEQQGGGMGLPIANLYAKIHHGSLEFKHRDGGGSIASLVIPIVQKLTSTTSPFSLWILRTDITNLITLFIL